MTLRTLFSFFFRNLWKLIREHKSWPFNLFMIIFTVFVLLVAFIDIHFNLL